MASVSVTGGDMSDGAFVLGPAQGRIIDMGPFRMTVKADGAQTGGSLTVLESEEPADFGPPLHTHEDAAEAFYVLVGEYMIFLGEAEHRCPAGTFIYIPAGVPHGFRVGAVASRKLNIYVPSAMTGYFDEMAAATAAGTLLDDAALTDLAARYSMRVIGPVPTGYV
jgi:quercetin dioxygenase-like cupin family protein